MQVGERQSAIILPFPVSRRPAARSGLTVSDRIIAMDWAEGARGHGVKRVEIHDPEAGDDPSLGSFLLVYLEDEIWASMGLARCATGYEVWRPSSGAIIGHFKSIARALSAVLAAS